MQQWIQFLYPHLKIKVRSRHRNTCLMAFLSIWNFTFSLEYLFSTPMNRAVVFVTGLIVLIFKIFGSTMKLITTETISIREI